MKLRVVSIVGLVMTCAVLRPDAADQATLAVAGRANANVSIASSGSFVAAVWSAAAKDGTADVYAASSRDGGAVFSAPVRVNTVAGDARVNGEQPPRLALVGRAGGLPEIVVVWTTKGSASTKLMTARSADAGRTFSNAVAVSGTEAAGNRGWEALGADQRGGVYAAWLDHRRLAAQESAMAGHHHGAQHTTGSAGGEKPDGVAMAQLSDLYVAKLDGPLPIAVTRGVCYCCKTAIAFGPSGEIFLAWRHVYPGNLRDIAFTVSNDGGRTFIEPRRVSEDKWEIAGCPDDGPAIAVDRDGRVHIVWPTVITERGEMVKALFHAVSNDGRSFSARQRIPTRGQANHPQLALTGSGLTVVWDESGDGARRLAAARGTVDRDGNPAFQRLAWSGARTGSYPAVAGVSGGTLVAWTDGGADASSVRIEFVR